MQSRDPLAGTEDIPALHTVGLQHWALYSKIRMSLALLGIKCSALHLALVHSGCVIFIY